MTEDEAKTKWCPFARVVSNGMVANRDNANDGLVTSVDDQSRCIGSDCGVWRWFSTEKHDGGQCGLIGRL